MFQTLIRFCAFLTVLGSFARQAQAGGWSGGGEIMENAQNPWFLEDTATAISTIKYCVMSAADFPIDQTELNALAVKSLRWWENQFSNAYYPDNKVMVDNQLKNIKVQINAANFSKEPCSDTTDLRLQFGVLTLEQVTELKRQNVEMERYAAFTIRTHYDVKLRGKGFIYVSPDRGPKAFRGQNVRPEAWTDNDPQHDRLLSVLAHELGHVFGLGHSSYNDSIMSANLAEKMVSKPMSNSNEYLLGGIYSNVFFPKMGQVFWGLCGINDNTKPFREFFEIPTNLTCFSINFSLQGLSVTASMTEAASERKKIGIAKFSDGGQRRHQQLVTLWLPQDQQRFPGLSKYVTRLSGPASSEVQQSATFQFEHSMKTKQIFIQASPRYLQIGGVSNNTFIPDLLNQLTYGRAISGWSQD